MSSYYYIAALIKYQFIICAAAVSGDFDGHILQHYAAHGMTIII